MSSDSESEYDPPQVVGVVQGKDDGLSSTDIVKKNYEILLLDQQDHMKCLTHIAKLQNHRRDAIESLSASLSYTILFYLCYWHSIVPETLAAIADWWGYDGFPIPANEDEWLTIDRMKPIFKEPASDVKTQPMYDMMRRFLSKVFSHRHLTNEFGRIFSWPMEDLKERYEANFGPTIGYEGDLSYTMWFSTVYKELENQGKEDDGSITTQEDGNEPIGQVVVHANGCPNSIMRKKSEEY